MNNFSQFYNLKHWSFTITKIHLRAMLKLVLTSIVLLLSFIVKGRSCKGRNSFLSPKRLRCKPLFILTAYFFCLLTFCYVCLYYLLLCVFSLLLTFFLQTGFVHSKWPMFIKDCSRSLLCISTSFQVLCTPESWSNHFFQRFQPFVFILTFVSDFTSEIKKKVWKWTKNYSRAVFHKNCSLVPQ